MGSPPTWGLADVLTNPHRKNLSCYELFTRKSRTWADTLVRPHSGEWEVAGTCECGNEPSGSMKCEVFLD